MTWRTPSSLKWLISKRSRLSGVLLMLNNERTKLRDKIYALDQRAEALIKQLEALDQTFGLHEITVDPEMIRSVRPHVRKPLLPYGQLSRTILRELRSERGWLSTTEMVLRVLNHFPDVDSSDYQVTRNCLRRRLRALASKGLLERCNRGLSGDGKFDGTSESYWRIAPFHD